MIGSYRSNSFDNDSKINPLDCIGGNPMRWTLASCNLWEVAWEARVHRFSRILPSSPDISEYKLVTFSVDLAQKIWSINQVLSIRLKECNWKWLKVTIDTDKPKIQENSRVGKLPDGLRHKMKSWFHFVSEVALNYMGWVCNSRRIWVGTVGNCGVKHESWGVNFTP